MVNIDRGLKTFTSMMAYSDSPVNKTLPIFGLFGMDSGIFTVGDDGCISVWSWKKPERSGFNKRGRGRGRGGRGKGGQGDQGKEW